MISYWRKVSLCINQIPFLSKRLELKPQDIDTARTLMNIYSVLVKQTKVHGT